MPEVPPWLSDTSVARRVVALLTVVAVLGGCGTTTPVGLSTHAGPTASVPGSSSRSLVDAHTGPSAMPSSIGVRSIVALGDSVPAGSACGCLPYPELTAGDLSAPDAAVTAINHAVGGYTTQDVADQLAATGGDAVVMGDVANADVVELQIGANDVAYSTVCGTDAACYASQVSRAEQGVDAIVRRIRELTAGRTVMIVLLDYWSVWLGGAYAQAQGQAYVDAAAAVTDNLNSGIEAIADRTGSGYVDLRAAFKGPDYAYDETRYLAPDGDHPNAAGHAEIAEAAVAVIRTRLNVP